MAAQPIRITGMLSGIADQNTKEVVLNCRTDTGENQEIRIHPGVLGGLVVALIGLARAAPPTTSPNGLVSQPTELTGVRPAVGPTGRLILDLRLEGSLHFPVTFPPEAIRGLQTALAELQKVAAAAQATPPRRKH
jgi:hypothetical protein